MSKKKKSQKKKSQKKKWDTVATLCGTGWDASPVSCLTGTMLNRAATVLRAKPKGRDGYPSQAEREHRLPALPIFEGLGDNPTPRMVGGNYCDR